MKKSNTDIALGTIVVALLLAMAAWFLLFSPSLDDRAAAIEQTESAREQNSLLETQLAGLQADLARYDEIVAELEADRVNLPAREDPASIRTIIRDAADYYDVTIVNQTVGAAATVDPSQLVLADAAANVGSESTVDGQEISGLVATPIVVTVEGDYNRVIAFLTDLQLGDHRFIYVNSTEVTAEEEEGEPTVYRGEYTLTVFTFVNESIDPTLPEAVSGEDSTVTPEYGNPYGSDATSGS